MDVPRITYYAKVIDNLTGNDITNYKLAMDNAIWYYGKINGNLGGESQFIVEFDIWNNEPAFNHRTYDVHCKDAKNMKLGIEFEKPIKNDNENYKELYDIPFFYAKKLNDDDFKLINNRDKLNIIGDINPNNNVLSGEGDHCLVQTKIIVPNDCTLINKRYNFNLTLTYDFE